MSERASARVCLFRGWDGRNLGGGAAIAHARPLHLLRDRSARSLRGLLLIRFRHKASAIGVQKIGRAQLDGWMDGSGTEARDPACVRRLGDGAFSMGSTRAQSGLLCVSAAAFIL